MDDSYARLKAEEAWWQAMPAYERQDYEASRIKATKLDDATLRIKRATGKKAPA